jgi:hypothetical protein
MAHTLVVALVCAVLTATILVTVIYAHDAFAILGDGDVWLG